MPTTNRVAQAPKRAQPRTVTPRKRDLFAQECRNALAWAAICAEMDEANDAAEEVPE